MEVDELYNMFISNGIDIRMPELMKIFNIVDVDGSGSLSLDEFFEFAVNEDAAQCFREVVRKIRARIDKDFKRNMVHGRQRIPFTFDQMMNFLYNKTVH